MQWADSVGAAKGHKILKAIYGILNSSKKTNDKQNNLTYGSTDFFFSFFVCFLEELIFFDQDF